jgi:hypothetical protein
VPELIQACGSARRQAKADAKVTVQRARLRHALAQVGLRDDKVDKAAALINAVSIDPDMPADRRLGNEDLCHLLVVPAPARPDSKADLMAGGPRRLLRVPELRGGWVEPPGSNSP